MDYLATAERSLAPDWELIHFKPPRLEAILNSVQWTLIRPRLTLANTKLPPKTDTETTSTTIVLYITRTHVDRFRKIVCHCRWIQRLGIKTYYINSVAHRASLSCHGHGTATWDPKMRPHRVQQTKLTLACLLEVYLMPIMDTSIFRVLSTCKRVVTYNNKSYIYVIMIIFLFFLCKKHCSYTKNVIANLVFKTNKKRTTSLQKDKWPVPNVSFVWTFTVVIPASP